MTTSQQFKGLLAGVAAVALIGTAMAQGNPPNPAIKNAPEGAGQRSSQNTPMGETGTPTGGAAAVGSTRSNMGTTSNSNMGSPSGTSMGAGNSASDTTMASSTGGTRAKRRMRADRN